MDATSEQERTGEEEPLAQLLVRLQEARDELEGAEGPDGAVEALEALQETAREIATEVERRRRILQEERGDGQLDLL